MNKEIRYLPSASLRAVNDGEADYVEGYAIVFDQWSEKLGGMNGFRERVARGAVKLDGNVRALVDHDSGKLLASTRSGTLQVREDERGVWMRAKLPDTSYARDLRALLADGIMDQQSFSFTVLSDGGKRGDHWERVGDTIQRTLHSILVDEFSIVGNPAYPQTSAALRSADKALADYLALESASTKQDSCQFEYPLALAEMRLSLLRGQIMQGE